MKHRRHIPTQQEIEEQKVHAENKPPEPVNTYPCEVLDCECKRMLQPAGWDPAMPLPKLCRNCKHAEMYHVKLKKGEEKKKSSKRGSTTKGKPGSKTGSAASTARGTGRGTGSASAKKASSGKKKGSKK
jgi:hypothetical protein